MYSVFLSRNAEKALKRAPTEIRERLLRTVKALKNNPRPDGVTKLKGRDAWRVRVGEYRILYHIDNNEMVVVVIKIAHRREAYRR